MVSRRVVAVAIVLAACGGDDVPTGATESSTGNATTAMTTSSMSTSSTTAATQTGTETSTTEPGTTATDATDAMTTTSSATMESSSGSTTMGEGTATDSTGSSTAGESSESSGGQQQVDCPPSAPDTTLRGAVWGPNGFIPVSNALVYTSQNVPHGIPQEVYCASCEFLQCDDVETFTAADGSFELSTNAAEANYLVVQKGQFMRVSPLSVSPGIIDVDPDLTTLPDYNDPDNGVYIPRIAVANGSYDRLEDALGKFGLGDTLISGFEERLVPGTESFHLWDNGADPAGDGFLSQGTFDELVSDPDALDQYHIIFVPCSTDDWVGTLSDDEVVENIRSWVASGGRWYVADWANEWMGQVFPEYQTFSGGNFGGGDLGSYDSMAAVLDPGMAAWLDALPFALKDINPLNDETHPTLFDLPNLQTVDNWSAITDTAEVLVDDGMGGSIDVGHKIWLEGDGLGLGVHPLTVTGQFGCGKIQFTSYHTAEFFNYVGLSPQELVLVYTILEIGVCQPVIEPV